jgi:hypothetical protein
VRVVGVTGNLGRSYVVSEGDGAAEQFVRVRNVEEANVEYFDEDGYTSGSKMKPTWIMTRR